MLSQNLPRPRSPHESRINSDVRQALIVEQRLNQCERSGDNQNERHKIVARLDLIHNDDSLPTALSHLTP
jgi:hypothetical protein